MPAPKTDDAMRADISAVEALFAERGADLLADPEIAGLVAALDGAIRGTGEMFAASGAAAACADCGGSKHESCCFHGAQNWYDTRLLLINLLLGVGLPHERQQDDGCFFVGAQGCRLMAKYSYCLNFFCPAFQDMAGEEAMLDLRRQVGRELLAGLDLEMALMRRLGRD